VSCVDALPWAVVPAWHTLQLLLNGSELSEAALRAAVHVMPAAAIAPTAFTSASAALAAAAPPRAPHRLEWRVTLPPYGSALLSLQLRRPLLPVEDLPSDASRGLDLGAAAVRYRVHRPAARPAAAAAATAAAPGSIPAAAEAPRLLFTESALLQLPLADQSMPFNVISLTSTLVALFAGSMFNLLTRRHSPHGGGRAPIAEKAGRTPDLIK